MTDYTAAAAAFTGRSIAQLAETNPPLIGFSQDAAGAVEISRWDASLGPQPTLAELLGALDAAPTKAQLIAYAEARRATIAAGGIAVNIAAAGAPPQTVEIDTGTDGLAVLANAVQLTSTAPGTSFDWDQDAPVTLSGAQILVIQRAVGLFNQELFSLKTAIRAAINSGAVTTFAQIDDPTSAGLSAWPANS